MHSKAVLYFQSNSDKKERVPSNSTWFYEWQKRHTLHLHFSTNLAIRYRSVNVQTMEKSYSSFLLKSTNSLSLINSIFDNCIIKEKPLQHILNCWSIKCNHRGIKFLHIMVSNIPTFKPFTNLWSGDKPNKQFGSIKLIIRITECYFTSECLSMSCSLMFYGHIFVIYFTVEMTLGTWPHDKIVVFLPGGLVRCAICGRSTELSFSLR